MIVGRGPELGNCLRKPLLMRKVALTWIDISCHHFKGSESAILTNGDIIPALFTRMSIVIPSFLRVAYSSSTALGETKSAGIARTLVLGASASISFFVSSS